MPSLKPVRGTHDILFEDIRVGDSRDALVDLRVGLSIYSEDCPQRYHRRNPGRIPTGAGQWVPLDLLSEDELAGILANRGSIHGVEFRDIQLLETTPPRARVVGFGDPGTVSGIRFESIYHRGTRITDTEALNLTVETAAEVVVR